MNEENQNNTAQKRPVLSYTSFILSLYCMWPKLYDISPNTLRVHLVNLSTAVQMKRYSSLLKHH